MLFNNFINPNIYNMNLLTEAVLKQIDRDFKNLDVEALVHTLGVLQRFDHVNSVLIDYLDNDLKEELENNNTQEFQFKY